MALHVVTYRFKLAPTAAQRAALGQWVGACRYVYNLSLQYKKTLWDDHQHPLNKYANQKEVANIAGEIPWIGLVHSQTLQDVSDRLWKAYDKFFQDLKSGKLAECRESYLRQCTRRGRTPNPRRLAQMGQVGFARKGEFRSFAFKQGVKLHPNTNRIQFPKLGKIKYRNSRALPADALIKRASVMECADGWFVSLAVETAIAPLPIAPNARVGVDVGLKELAVLSTGEAIANPRPLRNAQYRLARCQRAVSRKVKGSANRKKAVAKLARQHLTIKNTRLDYLHKLTTRLIRENQVIATEQLNVAGMIKNHKLARSIADASWGELNRQLTYKALWYGRTHVQVAPHYTSQDCSVCGYRNGALTLAVRTWACPTCGSVHDRDVNAAINISNKSVGPTRLACQLYAPITAVGQESPCL